MPQPRGAPIRTQPGKKYRVAKDIVIRAGHKALFSSRMKQDIRDTIIVMVSLGHDRHFDWLMHRDDALAAGLIEEVPD